MAKLTVTNRTDAPLEVPGFSAPFSAGETRVLDGPRATFPNLSALVSANKVTVALVPPEKPAGGQ